MRAKGLNSHCVACISTWRYLVAFGNLGNPSWPPAQCPRAPLLSATAVSLSSSSAPLVAWLVRLCKLNQGPSQQRQWNLGSYSDNQCISLVKGEPHSWPNWAAVDALQQAALPRVAQWESRLLADIQTPTLQGCGWISEFDPEFLSVYIVVSSHNPSVKWEAKNHSFFNIIQSFKLKSPTEKPF